MASDGCVGGDLIERYKGTTTVCPVLAPQELHLSLAGESIVGKGDTVTFELLQFEVSYYTIFTKILVNLDTTNNDHNTL